MLHYYYLFTALIFLTLLRILRKMMNEYLCRNFVAEQIVSEMSVPRVNRRSGLAFEHAQPGTISATLKNQMLDDEGSKNYKSWLSR